MSVPTSRPSSYSEQATAVASKVIAAGEEYIAANRTPQYGKRVMEWLQLFGRIGGDVGGTVVYSGTWTALLLEGIPAAYNLYQKFKHRNDSIESEADQAPQDAKAKVRDVIVGIVRQGMMITTAVAFMIAGVIPALFLATFKDGSPIGDLRKGYNSNPPQELKHLLFSLEGHKQLPMGALFEKHKLAGIALGIFAAGFFVVKAAAILSGSWIFFGIAAVAVAAMHSKPVEDYVIKKLDGKEPQGNLRDAVLADVHKQLAAFLPPEAVMAARTVAEMAGGKGTLMEQARAALGFTTPTPNSPTGKRTAA